MIKKKTTQDFINELNIINPNITVLGEYLGCKTKTLCKCNICGHEWEASPTNLLSGRGCPECKHTKMKQASSSRKLTTEEFIYKAKETHGNTYDYSKVQYVNAQTKVCIICPKHGEFWQIPRCHVQGNGCPRCNGGVKDTKETFIEKALRVHGNTYNYDNVNYIKSSNPVEIICSIHGSFSQTPNDHLNGCGCPECGKLNNIQKQTKSQEKFIQQAKEVHGNKYTYNKVNYINNKTKVTITCSEHGDFEQLPYNHLQGQGCPKCGRELVAKNHSSKGELQVKSILEKYRINFKYQYTLKHKINNRFVTVDFIGKYNNETFVIEYNGQQHYKSVEIFGGENALELQQIRDNGLRDLCSKYNIHLIEIPYTVKINQIEQIIIDQLKISYT